jgi:hypothetical protein
MHTDYLVVKPIPYGENNIPVGTQINITRGVIFADGRMLRPNYQNFLATIITNEEKNGFNYLKPRTPIKDKL